MKLGATFLILLSAATATTVISGGNNATTEAADSTLSPAEAASTLSPPEEPKLGAAGYDPIYWRDKIETELKEKTYRFRFDDSLRMFASMRLRPCHNKSGGKCKRRKGPVTSNYADDYMKMHKDFLAKLGNCRLSVWFACSVWEYKADSIMQCVFKCTDRYGNRRRCF
eukprot:sb/3472355/